MTAAYNKTTFDSTIAPGGAVVYARLSSVPDAGAPWHVTLSGNYTMPPKPQTEAYLRADYIYTSRWRRSGVTEPLTVNYDALLATIPHTDQVNLRAGVCFQAFDLSLFTTNATNSLLHLGLARQAGTIVWFDCTFQPRTVGLTGAMRY